MNTEPTADIVPHVKKNQPAGWTPFQIKVEKGIDVPKPAIGMGRNNTIVKQIVESLEVGDSFLVPKSRISTYSNKINKIWGKGSAAQRLVDLGMVRVWRIK